MGNSSVERTWFGADLKEEKAVLEKIRAATKSPSMTDTARRMIRRIGEEMDRQGIENFNDADIQIRRR